MSQALSFNQIRAEVAALRRKKPIEKPVAIRSASRWLGAEVQADGDTTYAIAQCDSPLALRLALKFRPEGRPDAASGPVVRVVVTSLADAELSPDIFSRLHKQRVFSIDRWSLVQQQFAAESIDHGLRAPMPGRVVALLVKPGDRVRRGTPLLALEAMKMEHVLTAPADGVVAEICAHEGAQVAEGVTLVEFEPD